MNITVKKTDLKKIHDVACESWKIRITDYAMRNPFGDSVELKQEDIKNMFDAATTSQRQILVEIFGEPKKDIDFSRIKTGSKVMINHTGKHCLGIYDIDINQSVDVIFYKTPYFISNDNQFHLSGAHYLYSTFHQNGKYVLFSADKDVDYIVDVIEY